MKKRLNAVVVLVLVVILVGCGTNVPEVPQKKMIEADVQEYISELIDAEAKITYLQESDTKQNEDEYVVNCTVSYSSTKTEYIDEFILNYTVKDSAWELTKCRVNSDYTGRVEKSLEDAPDEDSDKEQPESAATSTPTATATPTPETTATPSPEPTATPMETPIPVTTVGISKQSTKVGNYVMFGKYEQDNVKDNGKEDIEWLVLTVDGDKALLISKYALDAKAYHESDVAITWKDCTLRTWLNNNFYKTAFTKEEKNAIQATTLKNKDNPKFGTEGGEDTEDKIFVLSLDEAYEYFGEDTYDQFYGGVNRMRVAAPTEYAKARGAWVASYGEWYDGNCYYWLRTPGEEGNRVADVYPFGFVYGLGGNVARARHAVRPAIWVEMTP